MSSSGDDHEQIVGYGKPPKHTQFKKGQSGNPSGRRKRDRTVVDANPVRGVLLEDVMISFNGKKKKVPRIEPMLRKLAGMAANGDKAAAKLLFDNCGGLDTLLYWKPGKGSN
jgi:hypothetical protein